jgi:hypothetical protein
MMLLGVSKLLIGFRVNVSFQHHTIFNQINKGPVLLLCSEPNQVFIGFKVFLHEPMVGVQIIRVFFSKIDMSNIQSSISHLQINITFSLIQANRTSLKANYYCFPTAQIFFLLIFKVFHHFLPSP